MDLINQITQGDCGEILQDLPDNSVDLIFTSPPYADQRKNTYGGVKPNEYVDWFLPKTEQFWRVLKPTGTFVLNIKERVVNGERHTYVIELILKMREQGWLWTEEFMWHKKNSLYIDIIEPIGYRAKQHNDAFISEKGRVTNLFTKKFIDLFCEASGEINWEKLVEWNSGNYDLDKFMLR